MREVHPKLQMLLMVGLLTSLLIVLEGPGRIPEQAVQASIGVRLMPPPPQGRKESGEEMILRKRVTAFYSSWQKQDAEAIWSLLSADLKRDTLHGTYVSDAKKFFEGITLSSFKIGMITWEKPAQTAVVYADIVMKEKSENRISKKLDKTRWTLLGSEKKQWYFEGTVPDLLPR